MDSKKLVRSVLKSFLLSDAAGEDGAKGDQPDVRGEAGGVTAEALAREVKMELGESGGRVICELSDRRYVTRQDYNGTNMVSIRDYYIKDGKNFPVLKVIAHV
ncbi:RNA polymerase II transcriptional coactivator KELP-like [Syzygium oleosum]|uniref:RNA polymerase II transcriptional coactivator KELP-like n=1 Tax=Syzygium oleosum TaxID=219896 RepID=UPI0011D1B49A|nr:RNA polymerase II transcriptional coactivator KELP-like [Syzygium oleosum]